MVEIIQLDCYDPDFVVLNCGTRIVQILTALEIVDEQLLLIDVVFRRNTTVLVPNNLNLKH